MMDKKHDDKKTGPVIPDRLLILLLIFMGCLLIVPGCISQPIAENRTGNTDVALTPVSAITLDEVTKELLASQERLALYRTNLTDAKRRIPNNLLFIIDPNYPSSGVGTPAQAKKIMIARHQLIPAEQASTEFNLSPSGNQPVGDQVYLYIFLNASAHTAEIDAFVTNVTNRDEKRHVAVAWVDLNNLVKLMSVRNVDHIRIVEPPGTDTLT